MEMKRYNAMSCWACSARRLHASCHAAHATHLPACLALRAEGSNLMLDAIYPLSPNYPACTCSKYIFFSLVPSRSPLCMRRKTGRFLYKSKYCSILGDLLAQADKISEQQVLRDARPFGASIDDENPYIVTGGRPNAA